jgi:hypothetical protein
MTRLNLRTTVLEKFRRYIEEVSDYETEESLMETLSGVFKGNEYTRIGTAFHKIVECGDISEKHIVKGETVSIVKIDDFSVTFNKHQVQTALDYKAEINGCFHEIRAYKDYTINGQIFNISGCTDVLLGRQLRDIKTKYSYIKSISDYTDSIQSKLYMDIFDIPEFYFDVFEFVGYDKAKHGYDVSTLQIKRHEPIHCIAYEGMTKDIELLLSQFLDFIKFRKIEHLFYKEIL